MSTAELDLATLVARARDRSLTAAARHEAFGALVARFHNLAIALAYTRLRDRSLAEDATQDAFLSAWEHLDQLRVPDAFPGWIRRLVFTQCERRRRSARITVAIDDDGAATAATQTGPLDVGCSDQRERLSIAAGKLRPSERLILSLYYGCERSHREIASWLGVPVTTVARRLSHARRRLHAHARRAFTEGCRAESRRFADAFVLDLSAGIHRLHTGDRAGVRELVDALDDAPVPRLERSDLICAYLVVHPRTRKPAAYAAAFPTIFRPIFSLQLAAGDRAVREHAADALVMQIVEDLTAKGAVSLQYRATARQRAIVEFLQSREFIVVDRSQHWRFDVSAMTTTPADVSHSSLTFVDLARLSTTNLFEQALDLLSQTVATSPDAGVALPIHPDTLRRLLRAQQDGLAAIDGERLVGFIGASAQTPLDWRINVLVAGGTLRNDVGAELCQRLIGRFPSGTVHAFASPDSDLHTWLARFGFVRSGEIVLLERLLQRAIKPALDRLDEYVGTYVVASPTRSMPAITIERHGEVLVSKAADMRDVLLASSETEFFTRHHEGRGRFERDSNGRVARLVFTDSGREFVALRRPPDGADRHGASPDSR